MSTRRLSIIAAIVAAGVGPALAAGPKKIKQPSAFPIVISTKGSYILTSNLNVTATGQANPENLTAISVTVDDVSIDFNGVSIQGPTVCTGGPPVTSCTPTGTGKGVTTTNQNVVVRNGTVRGMGNNGIDLGFGSRAEHMQVLSCGGIGITAEAVENSVAESNGGGGIASAVAGPDFHTWPRHILTTALASCLTSCG